MSKLRAPQRSPGRRPRAANAVNPRGRRHSAPPSTREASSSSAGATAELRRLTRAAPSSSTAALEAFDRGARVEPMRSARRRQPLLSARKSGRHRVGVGRRADVARRKKCSPRPRARSTHARCSRATPPTRAPEAGVVVRVHVVGVRARAQRLGVAARAVLWTSGRPSMVEHGAHESLPQGRVGHGRRGFAPRGERTLHSALTTPQPMTDRQPTPFARRGSQRRRRSHGCRRAAGSSATGRPRGSARIEERVPAIARRVCAVSRVGGCRTCSAGAALDRHRNNGRVETQHAALAVAPVTAVNVPLLLRPLCTRIGPPSSLPPSQCRRLRSASSRPARSATTSKSP